MAVWQKTESRDDYCSFIMPQDEMGPTYVIGTGSAPYKGTCASADLAAVMAIAARWYSSMFPHFPNSALIPACFSRILAASILQNLAIVTAMTNFRPRGVELVPEQR